MPASILLGDTAAGDVELRVYYGLLRSTGGKETTSDDLLLRV
jgi:hypothetical protein